MSIGGREELAAGKERIGGGICIFDATAGGNPWSGRYDMFQIRSAATSEQVSGEYTRSRDEVHALTGEDSGSAYFAKSAASVGAKVGSVMGGPAR